MIIMDAAAGAADAPTSSFAVWLIVAGIFALILYVMDKG